MSTLDLLSQLLQVLATVSGAVAAVKEICGAFRNRRMAEPSERARLAKDLETRMAHLVEAARQCADAIHSDVEEIRPLRTRLEELGAQIEECKAIVREAQALLDEHTEGPM